MEDEGNGKLLHILGSIDGRMNAMNTEVSKQRTETREGIARVHKRVDGLGEANTKMIAEQSAMRVTLRSL